MFKKIKQGISQVRDHVGNQLSISSDSFTYGLICVLVVLGPLFFIPVSGFSIATSKGFLMVFIGILGLLAYGIHVLRKGVVSLPRHRIFLILGLISLAGILGSIFSLSFGMSFFGYGFETTTWLFMTVFALIIFFAYRTIQSFERVGILYGGVLVAFFVLVVIHVVRFIAGPTVGTLGVLGTSTSSLIGSWGDLGIFFGFVALFCTMTLELAGLKKSFRWILGLFGLVSVVLLAFMNVTIVWVVLGLVTLLLALYLFSFAYWNPETKAYRKESRVPWYTLSLFVIAVICIFFGGLFNNVANRHQNISWNAVRLSVSMTARVAAKSWSHNFLTGYGPNMFSAGWGLAKPPAVAGSNLSSAAFDVGSGYMPTHIANEGILGAVLWVGFFIMLLFVLVRRMGRGFETAMGRYFTISLGMLIFYLSIMAWVYIPGSYILALLAVLIGAFISVAPSTIPVSDMSFSFIKDPRASFFGILGITVVIVATLFGGYIATRKLISFVHYSESEIQVAKGNNVNAENEMSIAAAFAPHDIYEAALSNFALNDASKIIATANSTNKDSVSKQAEQILGIALGHAQLAVAANPSDYQNWITEGNAYQFMVTLGVTGAFDQATAAYQQAEKRDPNDATIKLYFAQLDVANGDTTGALGFIADSINMYPTQEAYVLRAQVQLSQQDSTDALVSMKAAIALDPYNADLYYEYGLMLFGQKDYSDAIVAFEETIALDRNYGIAYVYLGVSYEYSGDITDANKVYDYLRQQSSNADTLINQVKSNTAAPAPAATTTSGASTTPSSPTKPSVAPKRKK